jgi:hypothetical protein
MDAIPLTPDSAIAIFESWRKGGLTDEEKEVFLASVTERVPIEPTWTNSRRPSPIQRYFHL